MGNNFLQKFTEDDLWVLATDLNAPVEIREAAMRRWLFPEEYGYVWAKERINTARKLVQIQRSQMDNLTKRAA